MVIAHYITGISFGIMTERSAIAWINIKGSGYFVQLDSNGKRDFTQPSLIKFVGKNIARINPVQNEITLPLAHNLFTNAHGRVRACPDCTYINWCNYVDKLVADKNIAAWVAQGWRESMQSYNVKNLVWKC